MSAVCSPRVRVCSVNILNVLRAIKAAASRLSGVITTTAAAMTALTEHMKNRVPTMVRTPVNSCVKPISRPSANWSTSAMTRLTTSPVGCRSR